MNALRRISLLLPCLLLAGAQAQTTSTAPEKNMALELRNMILSLKPDGNAATIVMDVNVDGTVISVMSSAEGDASIYLSSGGAMIGGGQHANVRSRAISFANEAAKHKAEMQPVKDYPYPEAGKVRFYLRVRDGVFVAEATRSELEAGTHALSHVYALGQEVFAQFKSITPRR